MKKSYIIGITGGSGSGKTTFLRRLAKEIGEEHICIVSQDDYYRPKEQQKEDKKGVANFDRPNSIYKKEFVRDIKKLIAGEVVEREEYTFNNTDAIPKVLIFKPAPIIIVEGLFVFHYKKLMPLFDLRVFVHAKDVLKVSRRIYRDRVERNYPLDDVLYRYQHHVAPNFEKYIKPYMEEADIVINNNKNFDSGLEVLIGFLKGKI